MNAFDFSNLKSPAPIGTRVLEASETCYRLQHKRTGTVFTVTKDGNEFVLWARTSLITSDQDHAYGRIIQQSTLTKILYLIGVVTKPLPDETTPLIPWARK